MSVILVIQPDHAQAKVLRDVARTIHAELEIVDSTARAVDAIARRVPDLILVSPFLSPRDEDTLMARLRSLDGASHVQTVSIPQFCTTTESAPSKKSAFGFGKKKKAAVPVGADPVAFAGEVAALLTRATEAHKRAAQAGPAGTVAEPPQALAPAEPVWEVSSPAPAEMAETELEETAESEEDDVLSVFTADMPLPADTGGSFLVESIENLGAFEPQVAEAEVEAEHFDEPEIVEPSIVERPAAAAPASSIADEIDQLVRQLGLDVSMHDADASAAPQVHASFEDDAFDFGESLDRARNGGERLPMAAPPPQIDADAIREAAVAEARATAEREAREASAAEIARVLAEAESLREAAIAEARAAAETEARQALAADRLRVQAETEQMRETAIAEARAVAEREARDTLAAEVARVRSEAELSFSDALNRVKVEAEEAERRGVEAERAKAKQLNEEAQKAFAVELARVRAEVEESLTAQLDAARAEAERVRLAEAEAVRARAAVEHQLKADIERLRFVTAQTRKADETETKRAAQLIKQLEAELATVRAKAEERKGNELEEIRAQMVEMREAAAEHARAAAAEAIAAEVARATAQAAAAVPVPRPTAVITQFPFPIRDEVDEVEDEDEEDVVAERHVSDYLRLWDTQTPAPVRPADVDQSEAPLESLVAAENLRRHAKWALPLAACLLVVANTGTAISTVTSLVRPDERPTLTVQAMHEEPPFIEVVEKRVGSLNVKSTPPGAEAILDGKKYGRTPVTIPDLDVGLHTLVLKSASGSITRKVTIKANQATELNESIYSGWLAIFSPIPVSVTIDGQPVNLTDDARIMTSPGRHVVEFRNDQFGLQTTETLEVQAGIDDRAHAGPAEGHAEGESSGGRRGAGERRAGGRGAERGAAGCHRRA